MAKTLIYTLVGTLGSVTHHVDSKNRPYAKALLTTTFGGKQTTRLAMAFAAGFDKVKDVFVPGEVRLTAFADGGTFNIVGLGKSKPQAAAPAIAA